MHDRDSWPSDIATEPKTKLNQKQKLSRKSYQLLLEKTIIDNLLPKYRLWETLQIESLIKRFITNCRTPSKDRIRGPITTIEINGQKRQIIKNAQKHAESFEAFESQKQTLNLQKNFTWLYECRDRIEGHYPLFFSKHSALAEKIVEDAHIRTLPPGGVNLTMTEVRRKNWILPLRSLTKRVRKVCYGCKRF